MVGVVVVVVVDAVVVVARADVVVVVVYVVIVVLVVAMVLHGHRRRGHCEISCEIVTDLSKCTTDFESLWVKMSLPETRDTYIGNIYRPPDGNIDNFVSYLEESVSTLHDHRTPDVILMSDYNIDLGKKTTNAAKLEHFASNNLLTQKVESPTRTTNTGATIIDHIYVSNDDFYCMSGVTDPGLSDHSMTYVTRKRLKIKREVSYITGHSYRNFNEELFRLDIECLPWAEIYEIDDPNMAANLLTSMILSVADKHAPYKRIKTHSNQAKWVTTELLSLIDEKQHWSNRCSNRC